MRSSRQPDRHRAAVDGLARAASAVARRGRGPAIRRFLRAIGHLLEVESYSRLEAQRVRGHQTPVSLSLVLVRPDLAERASSGSASSTFDERDLVGVYLGWGQPLFLLPGGLFFQPKRFSHVGDGVHDRAGRWVPTAYGVELTGSWNWVSDILPPFNGYQRFRAEAKVVSEAPSAPSPSPDVELPVLRLAQGSFAEWWTRAWPLALLVEARPMRQLALWGKRPRRTAPRGPAAHARRFIRNAEAWFAAVAAGAGLPVSGDPPTGAFEPTPLSEREASRVEDLATSAGQLAAEGLVEEPLRHYAEILARHPSHAARLLPSVSAVLRPRLLMRERPGREDWLHLTSRLTFLRLLRSPSGTFEVDAGTWSQKGRCVTLRGRRNGSVDLARESQRADGYKAMPLAPLPAHVKADLKMTPRDLSEEQAADWLDGLATMWIGRLNSKK